MKRKLIRVLAALTSDPLNKNLCLALSGIAALFFGVRVIIGVLWVLS